MRRRGTNRYVLVLSLLMVLGGAATAWAAAGAYHEDDRFGFKVRTPKGWNHVALSADEQWIAGKFISDKTFLHLDKETGWSSEFRPDMTIIAFIDEVLQKERIEELEDEEGEAWIRINNPYKGYKDYLKKTYSGGGWFIDEEEEGEVGDVPVTKYVIKVEKLTRSGPKRIITWIYHIEDVDIAVQFEVLEKSWRKLKGDVQACLKSFKEIPRKSGSLVAPTTGNRISLGDLREGELSPEDRMERRKEREALAHKKAIESLPDDWKAKQMGRFLVLNHADDKFAKKMVAQGESIWKWLDKNLAYIGEGEYVSRPILRICKDQAEEYAFRESGNWWTSDEIVTHQDKGSGAMSYEFEYVNRGVYDHWFSARNQDLKWAMPYWLGTGFRTVLGTARAKGSRLEFDVDDWEREKLRKFAKAGETKPLREFFVLRKDEYYEGKHNPGQAQALMRFLLDSKKNKKILDLYLKNLQDVVAEKEAEAKAKSEEEGKTESKRPETEEEEEEMHRKRKEALTANEQQFMEEVFERTFGDWSDKDWRRLDALFQKSIG